MNILILGGVCAGAKAAAKLKRADRSANVTILTKDANIAYSACGLPYYVGGVVQSCDSLTAHTPASFEKQTGAKVLTAREAIAVETGAHTVKARNLLTQAIESYSYDKLIIATGASPLRPELPGIDLNGIFAMRTPEDAAQMRAYVTEHAVKRAVLVGAGFTCLEIAENLKAQGVDVTLIDASAQLLPGVLDPEMAAYVKKHLAGKGIRFLPHTPAVRFLGKDALSGVETAAGTLPCELALVSMGIRPNTDFLSGSGIELSGGAIVVDRALRTNLPDVWAAGDCAIVQNRLTGEAQWAPMGSAANMEGRTLAQVLTGADKAYPGVLGTGILRLPGLNCGRTGLSEAQAVQAGYDAITALAIVEDRDAYYPGASFLHIKLIADKNSHKLLGVQALGQGAVDKLIDIAVTGLNMGATLEDFENADYAYAPPFSTAIHPLVQAVYILQNKLSGAMISMTPADYAAGKAEGYRVVDTNASPAIRGAMHLSAADITGPIEGLGKDEKILLVCRRGRRAYLAQNRLRYFGYTNTVVLEGGILFSDVRVKSSAAVSPEEMTRVKGLGFLWDKNTPDRFNARVITRNGKITAEESRIIAEAAQRFGSGELAMTTRLTVEIQGIPFDNIEPMRAFLAEHGLETGGTGPKVRPVVSCKGTTCQYGLCDTFALSEAIHERFYKGYHEVKLPHKFKIAVGGCPNNCVKPDLNDLGVIGQRVPEIDLSKCRGCQACQVERACPIKIAKVEDGKLVIPEAECNHCGRCAGKCPFGALTGYTDGYRVYIGGRWGKKASRGRPLGKVFTDREEVLSVVEKAILLFREQGNTGERFADTIARLGFENVERQLLADDLLARKEENLRGQKHTKGGATC